MTKILFLHGMFGQNSLKPLFIKSLGFEVCNPILDDWNFYKSVQVAEEYFEKTQPDLIVGSSRGGSVAMNIDSKNVPLVLLAPAWAYFGKKNYTKSNSIIIHSENDNLIPIEHSEKLAKISNCKLIVAGQDHRLNCVDAKNALESAIKNYF